MKTPNENCADLEPLARLLEAGELTPTIDKIYALDQAPEAMRHLEAGQARGKIVIAVAQSQMNLATAGTAARSDGRQDGAGNASARAPEPGTEHQPVQTLAGMAERRVGDCGAPVAKPLRGVDKLWIRVSDIARSSIGDCTLQVVLGRLARVDQGLTPLDSWEVDLGNTSISAPRDSRHFARAVAL